MALREWSPIYERHVAEDTVINLHHLCAACTKFQRESALLERLSCGVQIRLHTKEVLKLGSVKDLKAGYLGGCHLCAQLWTDGGGHRLDSENTPIMETDITVTLEARNMEMEYSLEYQMSGLQKWWNNMLPPWIGELGVLRLSISNIYAKTSKPSDINDRIYELFVYPTSSRVINPAVLCEGPEPVSSRNDMKLAQIKSWHRKCSESHSKCKAYPHMVAPGSQLPSRLLDLQDGKIKLECNVENLSHVQYTTLSHMWGPDPSICLQLTGNRLHDFMSDIPSSLMPMKYLEAIRITKRLGFHYIWIDSLCIIQDSDEDWKREALKMASVYGRTALNISFVYPPSDNQNHHHLRDPRVIVPCQLPMVHMGSKNATSLVVQAAPGFINKYWSPTTYKKAWPLLSRAWVFQERLLCSRNIYYGQDRLLWECCHGLEDEFTGPLVDSPRSKSRFHAVFAGIQGSSLGREHDESFKGQWCLMVEEYRLANLTYETDRIIAFSGIAKAIQSQTNFIYLAGIWKEVAELDLLWVAQPPSPIGDFYTRRTEMRQHCPSWSWFSVPTRPQSAAAAADSDTVDFRIRTQIYNRSLFIIYKAQVDSFEHPKISSDPDSLLYDFKGLSITLRTRIIPCTLEWDGTLLRLLPHGRHALGSDKYLEPKNAMKYVHDDMSILPGYPVPTGAFMILTAFAAWVLEGKRDYGYNTYTPSDNAITTSWQYAGLVVVPAGKISSVENAWQRIGCFVFSDLADGFVSFEIPFSMDEPEERVCLV